MVRVGPARYGRAADTVLEGCRDPFAPAEQSDQGEQPPPSANSPSPGRLAALDDDALLRSTKALAARSNRITATLLEHLAEIDARGAYRYWACPTLQTYCVYELRMSEDAALGRDQALALRGVDSEP